MHLSLRTHFFFPFVSMNAQTSYLYLVSPLLFGLKVKRKGKAIPVTGREGP
jgi:hypothetical protein